MWYIAKIDGEFLARMEDVIEIYTSEAQASTQRIFVDKCRCQLLGDAYAPLPMQPGKAKTMDYGYARA